MTAELGGYRRIGGDLTRYARLLGSLAAAGVTVTASALCQRFTPELAGFFLELLRSAARLSLRPHSAPLPLLERFTAVLAHDSTTVGLPAALATMWPGCGGNGGTAALKIPACLELQSGSLDPSFEPGRQHDDDSPLLMRTPAAGSLVLDDLGYSDLGRLADRSRAGVSWITRASAKVDPTAGGEYQPLWRYLEALGAVLRNTPGVDRRTRRPSAFEALEDPADAGLAWAA